MLYFGSTHHNTGRKMKGVIHDYIDAGIAGLVELKLQITYMGRPCFDIDHKLVLDFERYGFDLIGSGYNSSGVRELTFTVSMDTGVKNRDSVEGV